eukprot:1782691-Prymnesium_polylepis.2
MSSELPHATAPARAATPASRYLPRSRSSRAAARRCRCSSSAPDPPSPGGPCPRADGTTGRSAAAAPRLVAALRGRSCK